MNQTWEERDVARRILSRISSSNEIENGELSRLSFDDRSVSQSSRCLDHINNNDNNNVRNSDVGNVLERNVTTYRAQRSSSGLSDRRSSEAMMAAEASKIAAEESRAVSYVRLVVLAVLVTSAASTAIAVYFYTRNFELNAFRASFVNDSANIIEAVSEALFLWLGAADAYVVSLVSIARATNQTFPFVNVPDAAVRMAKVRSITKAVVVHQNHFVTSAQRKEWETFSVENDQWASDALELQKSDKNYVGEQFETVNHSPSIHNGKDPVEGDGPFLPTWHSSPVVSVSTTYNWDALGFTPISDDIEEITQAKRVVISRVINAMDTSNPRRAIEANLSTAYIKDFIPNEDDPSEPLSIIIIPIVDTAADRVSNFDEKLSEAPTGNQSVVGIFTMFFFWRDLLRGILPEGSNGIVCVFSSPCGEPLTSFTFVINGGDATYHPDYVRDVQYDYMGKAVDFGNLMYNSSIGEQYTGLPLGGEACPYTLAIYPSMTRESFFTTQNPLTFTLSAIFIFVFTSAVFLIYDICVERRQRKVMFSAVQSSANVSLLELMVAERTRRHEETNMRLEEANRRVTKASAAQLEHFACMSHEIRTPLNCIIGLSSLLLDTELGAMQEESMRMIVTSGDLLLTVVNDVLDYSKLESGNVEINVARNNLQETLNVVVQSIETKAQPKKLCIRTVYECSIGEYAQIDHRRLQQILYNLLGNAIKFSHEGGTIDLSVSLLCGVETPTVDQTNGIASQELYRSETMVVYENCADPVNAAKRKSSSFKVASLVRPPLGTATFGNMIRFVVKDHGKGIERKDFETIFQPFRQASAETERVYGGTGLGLAVTSKLVTAMGGNISLDSIEGEWSEFTVDLPFLDSPVKIEEIALRLKDTILLLVDDCTTNVADMSRIFRHCGLDFFCYKSMDDLASSVDRSGFLATNRSYICLAHERLFEASAFEVLAKVTDVVLLTHGPKYCVKEANGHYRSLVNVLPSVLIDSFATFVEAMLSKKKQSVTSAVELLRRTSFKFKNESPVETLRILIAEDNKINQKVLLRILKRLHFDCVEIVDDGKQACDIELQKQYDVILMDIQMPVMNGIDACKEILGRESNHPKPKIVFVTAHVSDAFDAECRAAGGVDFLPKPFNIGDIENCLRRHTQPLDITSSSQELELSP